jgi:hypothetical protein
MLTDGPATVKLAKEAKEGEEVKEVKEAEEKTASRPSAPSLDRLGSRITANDEFVVRDGQVACDLALEARVLDLA